jgi:hypothetical protein
MPPPVSIPELRALTVCQMEAQSLESGCREPEVLTHAISEIMHARLARLAELEASLQVSQRALLSRDISSLEKRTLEQRRLHEALAILSVPRLPQGSSPATTLLAAELLAAETRVLQLGRIQAALLDRAQRWLRTVVNLLAGVEKAYSPPRDVTVTAYPAQLAASTDHHLKQPAAREAKEHDSCRA